MKNLFKTTFLVLLIAGLASCDVLDTEPATSIRADEALVDGSSANSILNGAYSRMQNDNYYGVEYTLNIDLIADNAVEQGFFDNQREIDSRQVPIDNNWITSAWPNIYRVVAIANLLITEAPELEDPLFTNLDQVLGQAYAIRALALFDLLRVYGYHFDTDSEYGIPLLLEPIENNDFTNIPDLARSTVSETYLQIQNDLDLALSLLQNYGPDNTAMDYWSALALRARVNLYQGNYDDAYDDADEVITEGPFALMEDLNELYGNVGTSSESIFDLVFSDQDQSSYYTFLIQRDEYNVDPSLFDAFEEDDVRSTFVRPSGSVIKSDKYPDPTNASNAKILRLSEIYLIRSEAAVFAEDDPNAGLDDLNTIRNRAGLDDIGPFNNTDEFTDALLQERRVELHFEGHRFFDLVRFDRIEETLGMSEFRKVFPISRSELQVSENIQQNPGYATN
ncbi:RagB/SusD family nutrient uptake outer membrane protein [Rhodohalobacter sp. SW132]|uniref:RagB/SusD family nutrient uptake outer membrane protein n=1 Tax=Rhodohalobacter sp. SW132 TaxID=2293433 RepID=UPI000E21E122|nr:RagB/SusD family nutrient uptake outer membrane protein [Rhodohalobacter sp. SW132]REL38943.1 RagB/SusD family nutrient uptake outer membrane protein [Rhodohalobacter sp. SW132]